MIIVLVLSYPINFLEFIIHTYLRNIQLMQKVIVLEWVKCISRPKNSCIPRSQMLTHANNGFPTRMNEWIAHQQNGRLSYIDATCITKPVQKSMGTPEEQNECRICARWVMRLRHLSPVRWLAKHGPGFPATSLQFQTLLFKKDLSY